MTGTTGTVDATQVRFRRTVSYLLCAIGIAAILYGIFTFLSFTCSPTIVLLGECSRPESSYLALYAFVGAGEAVLVIGVLGAVFDWHVITSN